MTEALILPLAVMNGDKYGKRSAKGQLELLGEVKETRHCYSSIYLLPAIFSPCSIFAHRSHFPSHFQPLSSLTFTPQTGVSIKLFSASKSLLPLYLAFDNNSLDRRL